MILNSAGTIGLSATPVFERITSERPQPEQGLRTCLEILRLGKSYPGARIENGLCTGPGVPKAHRLEFDGESLRKRYVLRGLRAAGRRDLGGPSPLHDRDLCGTRPRAAIGPLPPTRLDPQRRPIPASSLQRLALVSSPRYKGGQPTIRQPG